MQLRIPSNKYLYPESEEGKDYIATPFCISDDNEFIPTACLSDGERIIFSNSKKRFFYRLKVPIRAYTSISRIKQAIDLYLERETTHWVRVQHPSWNIPFFCASDTIMYVDQITKDTITPLMYLAVKRSELFNIGPNNFKESQFAIVVNNAFIDNPEFFKFYRNINRLYLSKMRSKFDIVYTPDPMRLSFIPKKIELPRFNSVAEIMAHSSSINASLKEILIRQQM